MALYEHVPADEHVPGAPTHTCIIVVFSGHALEVGGVPVLEFRRFLATHFAGLHHMILTDPSRGMYHEGIVGVSTSVDGTTSWLRQKTAGFTRTVFMGVSAGGYAAILYGSLVPATRVIAFCAPTLLTARGRDDRYRDLVPWVTAAAATTSFLLYADPDHHPCDAHHASQSTRVTGECRRHCRVVLRRGCLKVSTLRDSGELLRIVNEAVAPDEGGGLVD
jgi:hypothetical protein